MSSGTPARGQGPNTGHRRRGLVDAALLLALIAVLGVAVAFVVVPLRSDIPVFGGGDTIAGRYCGSSLQELVDGDPQADEYGVTEVCEEAARNRLIGAGVLILLAVALYIGVRWALRGRQRERERARPAPGSDVERSRWLVGVALGCAGLALIMTLGITFSFWFTFGALPPSCIALATATIALRRGTTSRWQTFGAIVAGATALLLLALLSWAVPGIALTPVAVVVGVLALYRRPAPEGVEAMPMAGSEPAPARSEPPTSGTRPLEPLYVGGFLLFAVATPLLGAFSLIAGATSGAYDGWLFVATSFLGWLTAGTALFVSRRKGHVLGFVVAAATAAAIGWAVIAVFSRQAYCIMEA